MSRESQAGLRERAQRLFKVLQCTYPAARCELDYSNPLELLVATILSAQCTDKQVNLVTRDLFKEFTRAEDYANAPIEHLSKRIQRLGFFRAKARHIQACCRKLVERHAGEVPKTMMELTDLDGVGRKTANVVLGNAFGLNEGVVVDTHVLRLSRRLGLSRHQAPEKVERDLMSLFARDQWTLLSHLLIWHGRRRCKARRPECVQCELAADCPRQGVFNEGLQRREVKPFAAAARSRARSRHVPS